MSNEIITDTSHGKITVTYDPGVCHSCLRKFSPVEMVGSECYLCILKKWPPSGYFNRQIYKKAVAIALAFATPLTMRQARKVVRIAGLKNIEFLNCVRTWEPSFDFYQRAVYSAKKVRYEK